MAAAGTAGVAVGRPRVGTVQSVTEPARDCDGAVWWTDRHEETGFAGFVEDRFLGPGAG